MAVPRSHAQCPSQDRRLTLRYTIMAEPDEKPAKRRLLRFTPAAQRAYKTLPDEVRNHFGFALYQAELGKRHLDAKALHGFGGASVLEVVFDHAGATYRAVYTLEFPGFVYLVHAFRKKSKTGGKTPKYDSAAINSGLAAAGNDYEQRLPNERPAAEGQG